MVLVFDLPGGYRFEGHATPEGVPTIHVLVHPNLPARVIGSERLLNTSLAVLGDPLRTIEERALAGCMAEMCLMTQETL